MRQGGAYRRGAVAGLSLGEVFILLSFVLVLAVLLIDYETEPEDQLGHMGTLDARSTAPPDPSKIQTLSAEAESLRRDLDQAEAENAKLSEVLAASETELDKTREQFEQAVKENDNLASQLSAEATNRLHSETRAAEIAAQLDVINAELLLAEERVSALEELLLNESIKRADAEAEAEMQSIRADNEAAALAEAYGELERISQNNTVQSQMLDELGTSLESSMARAEAEKAANTEELAALEAELEQVAKENADLADRLSVEASERQLSESKTAEITSQLQELNSELQLAAEQISELEEDLRNERERRAEAETLAAAAQTLANSEASARAEADDDIAKLNERFNEAAAENEDLANRLSTEESSRQRAEEDIAELLKNLQELIAELQRSRSRLAQAEETIAELEDEIRRETALRIKAESDAEFERSRAESEAAARADATEQLEIQKEEALKESERRQAAEELARASVSKEEKGENPPCWYVRVPKIGGGTRERQIYALNILVTDEFIVFGDRGLPAGKPDRGEQGDFASEAKALGLPNFPYGERISDATASSHLERLFHAGLDKEVRSYSCWFFAQVWDQTSTDSRWRSVREDIMEPHVLFYRVKDDPWPNPLHQ